MDFKGAKNGSRESSWEAAEFQGRERMVAWTKKEAVEMETSAWM